MDYSLNKNDFKKFLLTELSDTRQDQLTFWKKGIPLPVDIIYSLFEKRATLLSKYLDHIGAAYLFAWGHQQEGNDFGLMLKTEPTKNNIGKQLELMSFFEVNFRPSGVASLLLEFSEMLLIKGYTPNIAAMYEAFCHEGKKYERIFFPTLFKNRINQQFPALLTKIGNRNGDMFANVIADELGIYRSGFGDVLVAYFNKLIDFILIHRNQSGKQYVSISPFNLVEEESANYITTDLQLKRLSDGSLWEPLYRNAQTSFSLNSHHPYTDYIKEEKDMKEMLIHLIRAMSVVEDSNLKAQEKKILEKFRQDVSRELRLMLEKK